MKRVNLGILTLLCAGTVNAQSSVTLYGIIDTGITYISNQGGKSNVRLDSGINQGSRFGFKGVEDLGSGLKAVFTLENGFDPSTGKLNNGGALFGRRAYVGLASDRYGTLTLGNDFDFIYDFVGPYTNVARFAPAYSWHLSYDIDREAGEPVNNAVKYKSPSFGGLTLGAMYGFSNVAGAFAGTTGKPRVYSAGFSFTPQGKFYAPFSIAGAYTKTDGAAGTLAQVALNATSIETAALSGLVHLGSFSINANYSYTNATPAGGGGALLTHVIESGLYYQFTPFLSLGGGYAYIHQKQGSFNIVSVGADYYLSKRTDVFLFGSYQHASAGAGNAGLFLVVAPGTTNGYSSNRNQTAIQLGIRQVF